MIKNEDFICLGELPWDGIWYNRQQIMSRLARHNRVFYINPIRTLTRTIIDLITFKCFIPILEKRKENLFIFHPPIYLFKYERLQWLTGWMRRYRNKLIQRELIKYGFNEPILWLARPEEQETIGKFSEKLLCYHIVDEYFSYIKLPKEILKAKEEEVAKRADIVIVSSENLYKRKRHLNYNTYLIRNAVDYDLFIKGMGKDGDIPQDIASIIKPVLGYVGTINRELDLELLLYIANVRSDWNIVLIGPVLYKNIVYESMKLKKLKNKENVYFLGAKKREDVPLYYKAIDVGIMPYKLSLQVMNSFPLKMFEYLACGKPVVSVDVPSVREYYHVVDIARSSEKFVELIEKNLKADAPDRAVERRRVASENTWDLRVEEISALLEKTLSRGARA